MKLLWAHPCNLYDSTSGAALHVREMLFALKREGVEVCVLSSLFFDSDIARQTFIKTFNLPKELPERFTIDSDPLSCVFLTSQSSNLELQYRFEATRFFALFHSALDSFCPDIVMTYSSDTLTMAMQSEAKLRGIPVVSSLHNTNYQNSNFALSDIVITDSEYTAKFYAKNRIQVLATGPFFNPDAFQVKPNPNASFVTFINPSFEKGASLFARLLMMAEKEMPDLQFLMVQSRANPFETFSQLKDENGNFILRDKTFQNVTIAPNSLDMKPVYQETKLLLVPSYVQESFGRVVVEAQKNGIPVLASNQGALPLTVGDGGLCLPIPKRILNDYTLIPTEEELRDWMNALKAMMADKTLPKRAQKSGERFDNQKSIRHLMEVLKPLFLRRASINVHALQNSAFRA